MYKHTFKELKKHITKEQHERLKRFTRVVRR